MTHPHITTYNSNYSQLTQFEGVALMGGVLSDNQGVRFKTKRNNNGRDTEADCFGKDCHVYNTIQQLNR